MSANLGTPRHSSLSRAQAEVHGRPRLNTGNGATNGFTVLTMFLHTLLDPVISLSESCPANNTHEHNDPRAGLFAAALLFLHARPVGTSEVRKDSFYTKMKQSKHCRRHSPVSLVCCDLCRQRKGMCVGLCATLVCRFLK